MTFRARDEKRGFWRYQFPALAWAALILALSALPESFIAVEPPLGLDKVFHAAIFFVLCILLNRAFRYQDRAPLLATHRLFLSLLVVIGYGITNELLQTLVPGRSPEYGDAVADAVGGLAYILYLLLLNKLRSTRGGKGATTKGSHES